jgi:hypothetical protein
MPIRFLLEDQTPSFSPEDVAVLTAAFEESLRALGLKNREDPIVLTVARTIIALAADGYRDPILLRDAAIRSFTHPSV